MKRIAAAVFSAPGEASLDDEPLVVHQRSDPSGSRHLLLFVHGLGGSRYGPKSTWGNFPRFLFEDFPSADVAMYGYESGASRFGSTASVSLRDEARVFADLLRDQLGSYTSIVLIGHSMGGLLCKATIHRLWESADRDTLEHVSGLILMATPQLGSLRVPSFLRSFSFDAHALEAHGELVTQINRTFEDHIALDERTYTWRKVTIPTWAVEGVSDKWVDPLSAGIGLPSSRRKVVRGSHTSIVKPTDKTSDAYSWVRERIDTALHRFTYDVFVAAAMAGHEGDAEYQKDREVVLQLVEVLKQKCNCTSVFYAGTTLAKQADFDPKLLALDLDMKAMRESRNFLLYYPKKIASSALYEAGWALVMGKPSIYITRPDSVSGGGLPFLLNEAGQAFKSRVRVFKCPDTAAVLKEVSAYGERLFRYGENEASD